MSNPNTGRVEVKVMIANRDRRLGAMIKALAVEVGGFPSVKGATKEFLGEHGYYIFAFVDTRRADEFRNAIGTYVPTDLVHLG